MKFKGFEKEDFDLFKVPGLEERMTALKEQLQPKFRIFAEELTPELEILNGDGTVFYPHLAKHARRKVNPPNDSWIAFSQNPRGYKMEPHFQITVWHSHLLIQFGIIYESKNKLFFAENLLNHLDTIKDLIPNEFEWNTNHMNPNGERHIDLLDQDFIRISKRLKNNKNGEVMVGLPISKHDALILTPEQFYDLVIKTWSKLTPLYKLSFNFKQSL